MAKQELIEKAIKTAITRHLVTHVKVENDPRCRMDILAEEATINILKLLEEVNHTSQSIH